MGFRKRKWKLADKMELNFFPIIYKNRLMYYLERVKIECQKSKLNGKPSAIIYNNRLSGVW